MYHYNVFPSKEHSSTQSELEAWVRNMADHMQPDSIHWCNGSQEEYDRLCQLLVDKGTFVRLDPKKRPNSFACFSDPSDVARVEDRQDQPVLLPVQLLAL